MIKFTRKIFGVIFLSSFWPTVISGANISDLHPYFAGRTRATIEAKKFPRWDASAQATEKSYTYMTASEMQSRVLSLTGFYHPAFEVYADVLGRFDPNTGLRTTDRPSLLSVLFMQQISSSVGQRVIEREIFLDDAERIVFSGIDLTTSPDDVNLNECINGLIFNWLGVTASETALSALRQGFRAAEAQGSPGAGYEWLLAMLLNHGGLYYY